MKKFAVVLLLCFALIGVNTVQAWNDGWGEPNEWKDKTSAPTVNDDATEGYGVNDIWTDATNDNSYILQDTTQGAAVWTQIDGGGGSATPSGDISSIQMNLDGTSLGGTSIFQNENGVYIQDPNTGSTSFYVEQNVRSDKTTVINVSTAVSSYPTPTMGAANQIITGASIYAIGLSGSTENFTSTLTFHRSSNTDGRDAWKSINMQNVVSPIAASGLVGSVLPSGSTVIQLDDSDGLTEGDLLIVGAQDPSGYEIVQITNTVEATMWGTGVTVTPTTQAHADNAMVSRVQRINTLFMHRGTTTLYLSDEFLATPGSGVSKYYEIEVL